MANPRTWGYAVNENGCWIWTGAHGGRGYPRVRFNGRTEGAHRVSFFLEHGYMPALVRHTCDVKLCINPDHLLEGTPADNSRDMVERGRSTAGERNPSAKLTREQVEQMRASEGSHAHVGRQFGVSTEMARRIRLGLNWR